MIKENLVNVKENIVRVCRRLERNPDEITIIGVTKFAEVAKIDEAIECGIEHIAENKVQEALRKYPGLTISGNKKITKHMIGHLQTNKVKDAIEIFDVIQSVDSLKLAAAIDTCANKRNKVVDVLIQVNTANEPQKYGVAPQDVRELVESMLALKNVGIRGLMAIAPLAACEDVLRRCFSDLREIKSKIEKEFGSSDNFEMRYLSMGMTDDYEIALEEGSNMLRIGRAIFHD